MPSFIDPMHVQTLGRRTKGINPHIQQIRTDYSQSEDRTRRNLQPVMGKEGGMHWNGSRVQKFGPELVATEVKFHWARKETVLHWFPKFCVLGRHDSWTAENGHIMWVLKIKEREERTGKEKSRKFKILLISGAMSSSIDGERES